MNKLTSKLLFDILMTAVWTALMLYSGTGSLIHEILGLGILTLFLIHIAYNVRLMRREIPRMFSKNGGNITIRYILVLLLTVGIVITGISGILISKEVLTGIRVTDIYFWTSLHHWAAYITLILIGIHIGLHLKMIGGAIARPFRKHPAVIAWMRRGWNVAAAIMIVCGSIASFHYELPAFAKATTPSSDDSMDVPESDTLIEEPDNQSNLMTIAATYPNYEATGPDDESLEEYLGSQVCTICPKCCPLTALRCSRGQSEVERATQEYYASQSDQSDQSEDSDPWIGSENDGNSDPWIGGENDGNSDPWGDDDPASGDSENQNVPDDPISDPDLSDILSIMGLYVGGTYYVSRIADGRRKRREYKGNIISKEIVVPHSDNK